MREDVPDRDMRRSRIYLTDETHQSILKAARLVGFPSQSIRTVPVDGCHRMDTDALERAIVEDRAAGNEPACVIASAGTTNDGTIDPMPRLADIAQREQLWLHVDAAYGGFFQLTERGCGRLRGIERAQSIVLDFHKGLFLPYGTGCLLLRDGDGLLRAHAVEERSYMRDQVPGSLPEFAGRSPEMTRPFRALRLWLPIELHGLWAFVRALDERLDLAERAYALLNSRSDVEMGKPPEFTIVTFRLAGDPDGRETDACAAWINKRGHVMVSTTIIEGRIFIRLAILGLRTTRENVDAALAELDAWLGSSRKRDHKAVTGRQRAVAPSCMHKV